MSFHITLGNSSGGGYYERISYPAGETQIRLHDDIMGKLYEADSIKILAHNAVWSIVDLSLLMDAVQSVIDPRIPIYLYLPYLPYARADRRFKSGDCLGTRVYANLIGRIPQRIFTLDVHSDKSEQWYGYGRLVDVSAMPFIERAIKHFANENNANRVTVLFPDEGAKKRYRVTADVCGIGVEVQHASKKRDPVTGKLSGFEVPLLSSDKPCLIVDDLCDGGGTFLGVREAAGSFTGPMGLYVTHGIFSKGFGGLDKAFDRVYCTDSYCRLDELVLSPTDRSKIHTSLSPGKFMQFECIDYLMEHE